MPTLAEVATRVREALAVDASYETAIIPYAIQRCGKRLLRDYHFPWAVQREVVTDLTADQRDFALPVGFKKELMVQFHDTTDASFGTPMLKREGFTGPNEDNVPRYYWMWNGNITLDAGPAEADLPGLELHLWYESMDWATNETWMLENFEDLLFTFTVFRLAAEKNKKELAEIYGTMWADDRVSLAKYANELQFDNSIFMQREATKARGDRYPIS
jgi:hypothetical protein